MWNDSILSFATLNAFFNDCGVCSQASLILSDLIAMGSGSTFNKGGLLGGVRLGKDTDGKFKFAIGDAGSYIHYDLSLGVSIKSDSFDVTASVADINV